MLEFVDGIPADPRAIMNKESPYLKSKHIYDLAGRILSSTKPSRYCSY
jgi:hypothetical protein